MSYTRKYEKTTGYWVYAHVLPTKEVYIGMSKQQPSERWIVSSYKRNSLAQYITEYGWDNIEHRVLIDRLTKEQAEQIEDWFITKTTADGFCINKKRSGGIERDNKKEYQKQYDKDHQEERKQYFKQYYEDHKDDIKQYHKQYNKQYREEHQEDIKQYNKQYKKQYYSTPEGKIYQRVHDYNRTHTPIETPKEAKQKYLEFGTIPTYIKNDDLI